MSVDAATNLAWPFALVLCRVTGMVVTLPFISAKLLPVRARVALMLAVSFALTLSNPVAVAPHAVISALLGELLLGVAAGLVVRIGVAAIEMAGELIGSQAGFGFSRMADPLLDNQASVVGDTFGLVAGAFFFVTNGHHQVIRTLVSSMRSVPLGTVNLEAGWLEPLSDRISVMFKVGLHLAAPIVAALLASQLALGLLSRVMPQLNLWSLGFVITGGVAFLVLAVFAPAASVAMVEILDRAIGDVALVLVR